MPLTPFHLGPAILFGLVLSSVLDLSTLLVASVIPDVEPFFVLLFGISGYQPHGFFHSYLGSSILAVLMAVIAYSLRDLLNRIMVAFRISQKSSFKKTLFTSFVGVYFHVFLDSFLYEEMMPFYSLQSNPFVNVASAYGRYTVIYGFCSITFVLGAILYFYKIRKCIAVLD